MTWVKGQSGNAAGRPPLRPLIGPALRALLARRPVKGAATNAQKLAEALLKQALSGDVAAIKLIYERIDGKPAEPVRLSGELGIRQLIGVDVDDI